MVYSQWLQRGENTFFPTDNAKTVKKIPPGIYDMQVDQNQGFYLFKKTLHLDEMIELDCEEGRDVIKSVESFWEREEKFKEYGFIYKRGLLLYGPPGTGKTSLINILADKLIKQKKGIVFTINNPNDLELYAKVIPQIVREIEPETPIITIIEDIDGLCRRTSTETLLINVLDGIEQLKNVVYIATTNYLEALPERILNRPNRFDRRIKIGFPTEKTRLDYIKFKLKKEDLKKIDVKKWLKETEGMTISHIGELIKSVIIMGNSFEESIKLLKELAEKPQSSHDYNKHNNGSGSIGFNTSGKIGFGNRLDEPSELEEVSENFESGMNEWDDDVEEDPE